MRSFFLGFVSILFLVGCRTQQVVKPEITFPAAYVINGGENSISVINLNTLKVEKTHFLPNQGDRYAHHIYLSPDQKKLAIAMPSYDFSEGHSGLHGTQLKGGVTVVDSRTLDVLSSWEIPFANHNAVFSPNGTEVWTATHAHNGELLVYAYPEAKLIHRANLGPDPGEIVMTSSQQMFVNLGESSFVARVPIQTKEDAKMVKVDLFPTSVWPGNDTLLIVENKNQKSINFIDLRTNQAVEALDLTFAPGFSLLIENELWICQPKTNRVHIFERQEGKWIMQAIVEAQEDAHALGKYQEKVLVVNQQGHSVSIFNQKTKQLIRHIQVGFKPNGIAILP